jgi:hypothetical protein
MLNAHDRAHASAKKGAQHKEQPMPVMFPTRPAAVLLARTSGDKECE